MKPVFINIQIYLNYQESKENGDNNTDTEIHRAHSRDCNLLNQAENFHKFPKLH